MSSGFVIAVSFVVIVGVVIFWPILRRVGIWVKEQTMGTKVSAADKITAVIDQQEEKK